MAYLTTAAAESRLEDRYEIITTLTVGDLDAASWELDASGPFIGERLDSSGVQELAFPRDLNPDGTENTDTDVPARILDWVALKAYQLTSDESSSITSESIGMASWTYATPRHSQNETRMKYLIWPYLATGGKTITVTSSFGV